MRPSSRPALVAVAALLPLALLTACSSRDSAVRGENGSGVDSKASQAPGADADQSGSGGSAPATG